MIFGMHEQLLPRFLRITTKTGVLIYNISLFKLAKRMGILLLKI